MVDERKRKQGTSRRDAFDTWVDRKLVTLYDVEPGDNDVGAFEDILAQFDTRPSGKKSPSDSSEPKSGRRGTKGA